MLRNKILINLLYIGIIFDVSAEDYENDDKSKFFTLLLMLLITFMGI